MNPLDLISWASGAFSSVLNAVWSALQFILTNLKNIRDWANTAIQFIYGALKALGSAISKAWHALLNIKQSGIWSALKSIYENIKRRIDWIRKYIIDPLKREQAQLQAIWNRFFLPIVKIFQDLERIIGIIGIFDKRLAQQLDQALWKLEIKITQPILAAIQRVNALTSYLESILTLGGYFDRITLLSSIWRDAGLIRAVLHNPLQVSYPTPTAVATPPLNVEVAPFKQFLTDGTGAWAGDITAHQAQLATYLVELKA